MALVQVGLGDARLVLVRKVSRHRHPAVPDSPRKRPEQLHRVGGSGKHLPGDRVPGKVPAPGKRRLDLLLKGSSVDQSIGHQNRLPKTLCFCLTRAQADGRLKPLSNEEQLPVRLWCSGCMQ